MCFFFLGGGVICFVMFSFLVFVLFGGGGGLGQRFGFCLRRLWFFLGALGYLEVREGLGGENM